MSARPLCDWGYCQAPAVASLVTRDVDGAELERRPMCVGHPIGAAVPGCELEPLTWTAGAAVVFTAPGDSFERSGELKSSDACAVYVYGRADGRLYAIASSSCRPELAHELEARVRDGVYAEELHR